MASCNRRTPRTHQGPDQLAVLAAAGGAFQGRAQPGGRHGRIPTDRQPGPQSPRDVDRRAPVPKSRPGFRKLQTGSPAARRGTVPLPCPVRKIAILASAGRAAISRPTAATCQISVASGYPNGVERQEIDAAIGYQRSSGDAYLQRLGARGGDARPGRQGLGQPVRLNLPSPTAALPPVRSHRPALGAHQGVHCRAGSSRARSLAA
jgi:hypothetical protein